MREGNKCYGSNKVEAEGELELNTVDRVAFLRRCHLSKELEAEAVGTSRGEHSRHRGQ